MKDCSLFLYKFQVWAALPEVARGPQKGRTGLKLKQWVALLLTGILALGLTGCLGKYYDVAMVVNGEEISSGLYLAAQYNAFIEAKSKVEDPAKSVFKQEVEGKKAVDWIRETTRNNILKFVAVEKLAREKEIVLNQESLSYLEQMKSYSGSNAELYKANGFTVATMNTLMANSLLSEQLFNELYAPGGELAPSDAELMAAYAEQNARVKYIMVPVTMNEGGEDKSSEVTPIAEKMKEELASGKEFEAVAESGLKQVYELLGREFTDTTASSSVSSSYINYTYQEDGSYSADFLETLKGQKPGDFGIYNMGNLILVYQKLEHITDEKEFAEIRTSVVQSLMTDKFDEYLKGIYSQFTVEETPGAIAYLSPKKIISSEEFQKKTTV